jgi:pimeloyl-ACP methyl ester carboxylesterase
MHVLEAGYERPGRPCVLFLHGFPELAYSWRKILTPVAKAGFHAVAPDLRGYGRTTGWENGYDVGLRPFRLLNRVLDALGLIFALGHRSVAAVVGHDVGTGIAAWCALVRPDVFRSAVMSGPVAGPPALPALRAVRPDSIHEDLAALEPPRKHYQWYYSTREANEDMWRCPQGVHAFLRAYYHYKSADWGQNRPAPLASWTADELAKMPAYYIMPLAKGMAETVAAVTPSEGEIAACRWLTEEELRVYASEYDRTGFQGGLQHYRCMTSGVFDDELRLYSGRTLDAPSCIIAGESDWGFYLKPGLHVELTGFCTRLRGCHRLPGAGHWVQQERPEEYSRLLLEFLETASGD